MSRSALNLVGRSFGKLKVLAKASTPVGVKSKGAYWTCVCACGKILPISSTHLQRGKTKSCGCWRLVFSKKRPFEFLYNHLISSAKKRKISWDISFEEFTNFIESPDQQNCHYCEKPVKRTRHHHYGSKTRKGYFLDRQDCRKGYTLSNIVSCCQRCNLLKGRLELLGFSASRVVELLMELLPKKTI